MAEGSRIDWIGVAFKHSLILAHVLLAEVNLLFKLCPFVALHKNKLLCGVLVVDLGHDCFGFLLVGRQLLSLGCCIEIFKVLSGESLQSLSIYLTL